MKIEEIEGSKFASKMPVANPRENERQKIKQQTADFEKAGGIIEAIPRGESGNMYTNRPLTLKQSRDKCRRSMTVGRRSRTNRE